MNLKFRIHYLKKMYEQLKKQIEHPKTKMFNLLLKINDKY